MMRVSFIEAIVSKKQPPRCKKSPACVPLLLPNRVKFTFTNSLRRAGSHHRAKASLCPRTLSSTLAPSHTRSPLTKVLLIELRNVSPSNGDQHQVDSVAFAQVAALLYVEQHSWRVGHGFAPVPASVCLRTPAATRPTARTAPVAGRRVPCPISALSLRAGSASQWTSGESFGQRQRGKWKCAGTGSSPPVHNG